MRRRCACARKRRLPRGVAAGDVLIGLASDGVHSNGYSFVRKESALEALTHSSYFNESGELDQVAIPVPASSDNERLEFLGDSVLGMITASYLFQKFPFKDEGFLTEIRSRMVSRESLNVLGRKLGLEDVIEYESLKRSSMSRSSMYGDALEAFIGAVYLDKGFAFTQQFVVKKILTQYFDLDTVVQNNPNFKSLLIEWAQKEGKKVQFALDEEGTHHDKEFTAIVLLEGENISTGKGYSKKKAEQNAAMKACEVLAIK
jgi:ribonuclease-3